MESREARLKALEEQMAAPGFWDDPNAARSVIEESNRLKAWVEPWSELSKQNADLQALVELLEGEDDAELAGEFERGLDTLEQGVDALELRTMLQGEDDHREAIVTIHPGAGGTESQDWAEMLMRMYTRWAERHGYEVNILDLQPGQEAGIKSATFEIKGEAAYGYLKAERGVHRLVRISPFDAQSRRHTSFASVFVYPLVEDDIEIPSGPPARAGSTSTRRTPRFASRTSRPASWCRASRSARSTRTVAPP